jgi:hypothetical protein
VLAIGGAQMHSVARIRAVVQMISDASRKQLEMHGDVMMRIL